MVVGMQSAAYLALSYISAFYPFFPLQSLNIGEQIPPFSTGGPAGWTRAVWRQSASYSQSLYLKSTQKVSKKYPKNNQKIPKK